MKAGKILLAAAFALTLAASANAGIHVWWEGAGVGGPGQTLDLECEVGTRCEWELTMFIAQDDASSAILGWAEDLLIDPALGGIVTIKNLATPGDTPWTNGGYGMPNYGPYYGGYHLLMGAYGQQPAGYVYGAGVNGVLTITLSVNPMPGPASYYIDILSEGGGALWGAFDAYGSYPYVDFFGAQDKLTSYSYGDIRTNAAIRIHAIPEPSTVAFLGLGALALIRRR